MLSCRPVSLITLIAASKLSLTCCRTKFCTRTSKVTAAGSVLETSSGWQLAKASCTQRCRVVLTSLRSDSSFGSILTPKISFASLNTKSTLRQQFPCSLMRRLAWPQKLSLVKCLGLKDRLLRALPPTLSTLSSNLTTLNTYTKYRQVGIVWSSATKARSNSKAIK